MTKLILIIIHFLIIVFENIVCDKPTCNRTPLGTKIDPLPPDNRFELEIEGSIATYLPEKKYKVRLFSRDNESTFIAFTIAAKEDTKYNEKNPRRPIPLKQGTIYTESPDGINSQECNNTVMQKDITPKKAVEVTWIAPPKGNGCVTLYALVAIREGVWYKYDGPLIKRVCEDLRQKEDLPPPQNDNCNACEEARYQLTLENLWSHNTHPLTFPENANARFGDLVGAVHSSQYVLWKSGGYATEGLEILSQQGNTTAMEEEIEKKFGDGVRALIKARGMLAEPDATMNALLRVGRANHFVSFIVSILPSPDWFLGVANLELCQATDEGQWAPEVTLNMYPYDAGTDSGLDFESPNDPTAPKQPITKTMFKSGNEGKPFAKLRMRLVRTYTQSDCEESNPTTVSEGTTEESYAPVTRRPYKVPPPSYRPPESSAECDVTEWEDWLPCTGECVDQKIEGFRTRIRYLIVDGDVIGRYDPNAKPSRHRKVIPKDCEERYNLSETEICEEPCMEDETQNITASRRIWFKPIGRGRYW